MAKDIVVLVAPTAEALEALCQVKDYKLIVSREFDSLSTDHTGPDPGRVRSATSGVVGIAKPI